MFLHILCFCALWVHVVGVTFHENVMVAQLNKPLRIFSHSRHSKMSNVGTGKIMQATKPIILQPALIERVRLIMTLYGRNSSLALHTNLNSVLSTKADIDRGNANMMLNRHMFKPYNLEELFEWILNNCKYCKKTKLIRGDMEADSNIADIADCLLELFQLAFQLTPSRFEVFINIYEKLLRLVRTEVMTLRYQCIPSYSRSNSSLIQLVDSRSKVTAKSNLEEYPVFQSLIDWTNSSILDWFPSEYSTIYNITEKMKSYRFDLTKPLRKENTTQIYKNNDIFEEITSILSQNKEGGKPLEMELLLQKVCQHIYIPENINNPGFDSCLFIKPKATFNSHSNANNRNIENATSPVIAVLGEQKISTKKSKLYINIYKDIVKKHNLAMKQVNKAIPFQKQSHLVSNDSMTPWNMENTLLVGHYLRRIHPKLRNKQALEQYLKRYVIKANTIIIDEEKLEGLMGSTLFELLTIARGRSRKRASNVDTMSSPLDEEDRFCEEMHLGHAGLRQLNNEKKKSKQNVNKKLEVYIRKLLKMKHSYQ